MSKIKIRIAEVLSLNNELISLNKETELTFLLKYDLAKLGEKTEVIVKRWNDSQKEILKANGVCVDENRKTYSLQDKKGKASKNYDKGIKALEELLDKEEEFTESFPFKDFENLKSNASYIVIMKFLNKQK